ncbi:MAG: hypothetical protein AAF558_01335, partial [Verrucomicrobiota bacterium]
LASSFVRYGRVRSLADRKTISYVLSLVDVYSVSHRYWDYFTLRAGHFGSRFTEVVFLQVFV